MRKNDKIKNINKANQLAEQRYLESKGIIKEEAGLKIGVGFLLGLDDSLKSTLNLMDIPREPNGEEMTKLEGDNYHVTLTSIRSFKPFRDKFVGETINIPLPNVKLGHGKFVYRKETGKITYVLAVENQEELKAFVDASFASIGEVNPEPNRFFHVTVANNAGGNSFKSIGDVGKEDLTEDTESTDIQVWFDLDGVLADMEGKLMADTKLKELRNILTNTINSDFPDYIGLSNDEVKLKFQAELKANPDNEEIKRLKKVFKNYNNNVFKLAGRHGFYEDLGLIDGGKELVKLAHKLTGVQPNVLSSPMNNQHSKDEKLRWVDRHFGGMFGTVILRTDKDAVIKSNRDILIDDRVKYVNLFKNNGGSAILFKDAVSAGKDLADLISKLK